MNHERVRGPDEVAREPSGAGRSQPFIVAGMLAWGLVLATWLARVYFQYPPGQIHINHENYAYAARVLEFRDLLRAGYLSPQWATHFRMGLGSPYFSYYQPGFFYVASLVPWSVPPMRALGVSILLFGWLGYAATFGLVKRWFGALSGGLAASLLLLSVYPATQIYVRGDLSEFCAMMLIPLALWALGGWIEEGRLRYAALLALAGGGLIIMHPAIALVGYAFLAVLAIGLGLGARAPGRSAGAVAALCAGIGLAAFYWFPVFFEWDLVAHEAAFTDTYRYSNNFVNPAALLGPYTRDTLVPFTLGPVVPALIAFNAAVLIVRRRSATRSQVTVTWIGVAALAGAVFLMTESSAYIWDRVGLLQRLQFPWRILALATVFGAAVAGAMLPWRSEGLRVGLVALVILASVVLSRTYTVAQPSIWRVPADVAEFESLYFAPDARNEWMPRDAFVSARRRIGELPAAGPGTHVDGFERSQGLLRVRVRTASASFVVLPHYYFPVGWTATMNGQPIRLGADRYGLMRIALPAESDGVLEVRFTRTPMRSTGLLVSGVTAVLGAALLVGLRHRRGS